MRTAEAASPVGSQPIALSLAAFIVTYGVVFGAGVYYIARLIAKGPAAEETVYGDHGVQKPPLGAPRRTEKGGRHV
jgi:cytochrome d ubiquinol oxidase subunit I